MKSWVNEGRAILISIAVHLLLLLMVGLMLDFNLLAFDKEVPAQPDADPLVFELEQPKRSHEVVETPEDAATEKPDDAELASDKNARARNPEADDVPNSRDPFSRGDFEFKELPTNQGPVGEQGRVAAAENLNKDLETSQVMNSENSDYYVEHTFTPEFRREYLTYPKDVENPGNTETLPKVVYDNDESKASDTGGLSFNTYEWDFAPYMLYLKKKVERNIYPPPAFTYLGMISGETVLRFRIMPDGELKAVQVIEYQGHETLMETSVRAIEISAPFKPLPESFPEDYLEVTAKFYYVVKKNKY